jgi:hypothetical protein
MSEVKVNKISPRTNCGTTQLGDAGDTITVTGDLKSNSLKSASGSTITLGQSGDTIQLGCGATQTGFGRTGTVDWDTTAKTASFTAVSGNGYFVNTTSGAITVTMPASPSAGDIVGIKDYAGTFATNNVTVARNGSNFDGIATDATLSIGQLSVFFVYVDGTQGWKATQSDTGDYGSRYITATGGTVTCCGDYKIHTFTGPGTFTVTCAGNAGGSNSVDYLVVAGGGAGGAAGGHSATVGGGGGAGGYRESSGAASGCYTRSPLGACVSALPVTVTGYPITIGGGATSTFPCNASNTGSNSVFSTITSAGGGGGVGVTPLCGFNGGSGGGGGATCGSNGTGGTGNTPPVSPPQGQNGGNGASPKLGGGGGGAIQAGSNGGAAPPTAAARNTGGDGGTTEISGTSTSYAGGGGGANTDGPGNNGGLGGGGPAPTSSSGGIGSNGTANTGGGGGGGPHGYPINDNGGQGGSGIVIIRYKYQ